MWYGRIGVRFMHIILSATVLANATTTKSASIFAPSNETSQYGVDGLFSELNQSSTERIEQMGNATVAAQEIQLRRQKISGGKERIKNKDNKPSNKDNKDNKVKNANNNNNNNDKNKNNNKQNRQQEGSSSRSSCFSIDTYKSIDNDIAKIKNTIQDDKKRSHFLGGIVRLAAHDFMDYNQHANVDNRMGADGCYDKRHPSNAGLQTIWCQDCPLKMLYTKKYSHLSRADFWIASANAVIRQTSIDNALDMRDTFRWGRKDADSCQGSGARLPQASGCDEVEGVFLNRMGLRWVDAVALLGAHTLGRAENEVSSRYSMTSSNRN